MRRFPSGCSGLLEVDRIEARGVEGRTELQLPDCTATLLQGWRIQATGVLSCPLPAVHPLLPGSAERLARQGSWSQLRVESIEVLQRPWTPLADLRRDVAQRLQQAVGPRRGGFLAALVLGSAQVQLPEDIRAAFRMAGLSHALAASGFHLSVLLGSVLMLARRWPPGMRLPLAAMALPLQLLPFGAMPLYALVRIFSLLRCWRRSRSWPCCRHCWFSWGLWLCCPCCCGLFIIWRAW